MLALVLGWLACVGLLALELAAGRINAHPLFVSYT